MKRKALVLTAAAAIVGLGALATTAAMAHGQFGPGGYRQGPDMMQGQGMKHGKGMHQARGYGKGNCGYGQSQALETPLTIDDVRANLEQKLKWRGNDRLKVGAVTEKDDKTISAEIVTVDDSLVRKIEIDKATGRHIPVK